MGLNPIMWVDGIKQSIQDGFNGVVEGITEGLSNMFISATKTTANFLLDSACTFIIFYGIFIAFKIMISIDEDKQKENFNTIGVLAIIYPIVKLMIQLVSVSSGGS